MDASRWIEVLVGFIILGTLAWLGSNMFEMKGTVSSIDVRLGENSNRIERIANVLPEMGRRIASEEIYRPVEAVVVSSKPTLTGDGVWQTVISFIDASSKKNTVYKVKLTSETDKTAAYILAGSVKEYSPRSTSLATIETLSYELDNPTVFPGYIDTNSSYVLREYDRDRMIKVFDELRPHLKKEKNEKISGDITSIEKLTTELGKNSEKYGSK